MPASMRIHHPGMPRLYAHLSVPKFRFEMRFPRSAGATEAFLDTSRQVAYFLAQRSKGLFKDWKADSTRDKWAGIPRLDRYKEHSNEKTDFDFGTRDADPRSRFAGASRCAEQHGGIHGPRAPNGAGRGCREKILDGDGGRTGKVGAERRVQIPGRFDTGAKRRTYGGNSERWIGCGPHRISRARHHGGTRQVESGRTGYGSRPEPRPGLRVDAGQVDPGRDSGREDTDRSHRISSRAFLCRGASRRFECAGNAIVVRQNVWRQAREAGTIRRRGFAGSEPDVYQIGHAHGADQGTDAGSHRIRDCG